MNNTDSKITAIDLPYIRQYQDFLKENDWEIAKTKFIAFQPEHLLLDQLKQEHSKLVEEISPLNESIQQLQSDIVHRQIKQEEELQTLEYILNIKNKLLSLLPKHYQIIGRKFINDYIIKPQQPPVFPWETLSSKKEKIINLIYRSKLQKFEQEFADVFKNFQYFSPRFNILQDKNTIIGDIKNYYRVSEAQQKLDGLSAKSSEIEQKQLEIAQQTGQARVTLDNKTNILKSYFDKSLFQKTEDVYSNYRENDQFFEQLSIYSSTWEEFLQNAKSQDIHFAETYGIENNGTLLPAIYKQESGLIFYNKSFTLEEQLFAIANILSEMATEKINPKFNIKAIYQQSLCIKATAIIKIMTFGEEISPHYPKLKDCISRQYINEYSAYTQGKDNHEKTFVAALSSLTTHQSAEAMTLNIIQKNSYIHSPCELPLGDLLSPFIKYGAPLIDKNPTIGQILNKIPLNTKNRLQDIANKYNDYSLITMKDI